MTKKRRSAYAVSMAVATAAIPASMGVYKWEVLAGAAVLGAVGGAFGVNVPQLIKGAVTKKAPP
jgi:hypothetical protein